MTQYLPALPSIDSVKRDLTTWVNSLGAGSVSKPFFEMVKAVGDAKSKQEEATILDGQVFKLKEEVKKIDVTKQNDSRVLREILIRLLYVELLSQKAEFAYKFIVDLTQLQKARLCDKRIAYICGSLFLRPKHMMTTLWVNSFRRDLQSANSLEVEMALSCLTCLLNEDAIPAVIDTIVERAKHDSPGIRKKAVMAMKRILEIDMSFAHQLQQPLRDSLIDRDPSVMAASLNVFDYLIAKNPAGHRGFIMSLISIQKQVLEHALARDYDWTGIPSPWIQIKIIKLLSYLGQDDKKASEQMYDVISETLRRADTGFAAGHAIVYQCLTAITKIYPNGTLLDTAAESISNFIQHKDNNLKFLGLKALNDIVHINPKYALKHQVAVIECLDDPDETIQRMTLEILYTMTNHANVNVVSEKLLEHLHHQSDKHLREDLVSKITSLAENFSPDNEWFIETMNKVFLWGGPLVNSSVAYNLLVLIAEGSTSGEDEQADNDLRIFAVESYLEIVEKHAVLTDLLIEVICWTLGEYSFLIEKQNNAIDVICDLMERPLDDETCRGWMINALMKLCAQIGHVPPQVSDVITKYQTSNEVSIQQRCCEFKVLSENINLMKELLPLDASVVSTEELGIDVELTALDSWIQIETQNLRVPTTVYREKGGATKILLPGRRTSRSVPTKGLVYKYVDAPAGTKTVGAVGEPNSIFSSTISPIPASGAAQVAEVSSLASLSAQVGAGAPGLGGGAGWGQTGWGAAGQSKPAAVVQRPVMLGGMAGTSLGLGGGFGGGSLAAIQAMQSFQKPEPAPEPEPEISPQNSLLFAGLSGSGPNIQGRLTAQTTRATKRVTVVKPAAPAPSIFTEPKAPSMFGDAVLNEPIRAPSAPQTSLPSIYNQPAPGGAGSIYGDAVPVSSPAPSIYNQPAPGGAGSIYNQPAPSFGGRPQVAGRAPAASNNVNLLNFDFTASPTAAPAGNDISNMFSFPLSQQPGQDS